MTDSVAMNKKIIITKMLLDAAILLKLKVTRSFVVESEDGKKVSICRQKGGECSGFWIYKRLYDLWLHLH